MKTSYKDVLENDFDYFVAHNLSSIGELDVSAIKPADTVIEQQPVSVIRRLWSAVTDLDLFDYMILSSPVVAAVFIFLVGVPMLMTALEPLRQGFQGAGW